MELHTIEGDIDTWFRDIWKVCWNMTFTMLRLPAHKWNYVLYHTATGLWERKKRALYLYLGKERLLANASFSGPHSWTDLCSVFLWKLFNCSCASDSQNVEWAHRSSSRRRGGVKIWMKNMQCTQLSAWYVTCPQFLWAVIRIRIELYWAIITSQTQGLTLMDQGIFLPPLSKIRWPYVHGFISGLSCSIDLYLCFCPRTILSWLL